MLVLQIKADFLTTTLGLALEEGLQVPASQLIDTRVSQSTKELMLTCQLHLSLLYLRVYDPDQLSMTTKTSGAQIAELPAYRRYQARIEDGSTSSIELPGETSDKVVFPLGNATPYEDESPLRCQLVPSRHAFYRYKTGRGKEDMVLSLFSAAVLVQHGCIPRSHLEP